MDIDLLGYISGYLDGADHVAIFEKRVSGNRVVDFAVISVQVHMGRLVGVFGFQGLQQRAGMMFSRAGQVAVMRDFVAVPADDFVPLQAQFCQEAFIHVHDPVVAVDHHHIFLDQVVDHHFVHGTGFMQLLAGLFFVGRNP